MSETRDTYMLLRTFTDELVRCGVRIACTSPGSRSAPIVLTLVRQEGLHCFSHVDERSAGFFALGAAKAGGAPTVVACTSGTAAANLLPAVVEAHDARVPLVVVTADRPPELRDNGAGQAIDQIKLYGRFAKWFTEVGQHQATPERLRWARQLARRAVWTASDGRPGVVHLNWPLREPLILHDELPPAGAAPREPRMRRVPAPAPPELADAVRAAQRPLVVAGRLERGGRRIAEAVQGLGVPLLADPLSRLRTGPAAICHYDGLLRVEAFADAHRPDLVVRLGDLPTSKPLRGWLARLEARQIAIDPEHAWQDPDAVVTELFECDPGDALATVAGVKADADWLAAWRRADLAAARAYDTALRDVPMSEPAVARHLTATLPSDVTLVVAASMPIRDVETFTMLRDDPPRVLANRGANGIDGTTSTAFGVATAGRTVLLTGDVALAHDVGGLLTARRYPTLPLTVVLLDNGGGGIFDFLPVSTQGDAYEEHVATPTGLDAEQVAATFGLRYVEAGSPDDVRAHDGPALVHVRSDRSENLALHRRAAETVHAALRSVRG